MLRRTSTFLLVLTFFGLISSNSITYRLSVFSQIHEIVFHGKGGYDYDTIYNMPIWLRNYTFNKIKEWYNQPSKNETNEDTWVKDDIKKSVSKNTKVNPPSYITKASKK